MVGQAYPVTQDKNTHMILLIPHSLEFGYSIYITGKEVPYERAFKY